MKKRIGSFFLAVAILTGIFSTFLPACTAASNEQQIYYYLINNMGMNIAASCGVLANIQMESSFNPNAECIDTNGLTSYGICQWNGTRFTALKNYCSSHGYDYTTLTGQLHYLQYELENGEAWAYSKIKNVENSAFGAYTAGYNWAQYFERCLQYWNGVNQYEARGNLARNTYWPKYSNSGTVPTVTVLQTVYCKHTVSLPARVVNLYLNPTDTSRYTYFDYGPTITCPAYAKMSDGSTMFLANVNHQGTDMQLWFKYESDMTAVTKHTYGSYEYDYAHPHAEYHTCNCGYTEYTGDYGARDGCKECIPRITLSSDTAYLDLRDCTSTTITVTLLGKLPSSYSVRYERSTDCCTCKWNGWDGNSNSLTITASKRGSGYITVSLIDKTNGEEYLNSLLLYVEVTAPTYTITYDANGGSYAPAPQTKYYGETLILTTEKPYREGYKFLGWSTSKTNLYCDYYPGDIFTADTSLTMYAVWEEQQTKISGTCGDHLEWRFDPDNGSLFITGTGAMYDYPYSSEVPWYEYSGQIKTVVMDGCTSIGDYAFYGCKSLTNVTIPDSVKSIGDEAFAYCYDLTGVTIPDSVTSIGDEAFYVCKSLTSVTIPDSVTSIGDWAFAYCTSLTSVTISDSVTSIGGCAFAYCTNLTSIWVNENNKEYSSDEYGVLFDKPQTTLIQAPEAISGEYTIPNSVTSIDGRAFYGCASLTRVTIPDSVESIGFSAFYCCTSLTSVTIPDSVTSIGDSAFRKCTSLTNVTIGNGVTSIGSSAFEECSSLTSVAIPDSVTSIGYFTFAFCKSLMSVAIPDSVTSIDEAAFNSCTSLTSVTISDSVTNIGKYAFNGCESLSGIWVDENNENYSNDESGVLFDKAKTTLIQAPGAIVEYTIPDSVTSIDEAAFNSCTSLTSVTIGNSVTSIDEYVFAQCKSLRNVTIPDSVTRIGDYAFKDCESLRSVTIPDSVTTIGWHAFYDCTNLTGANFLGNAPEIGSGAFQSWNSDLGEDINISGLILYYIEGKEGWTTPTWGKEKYPTATWDGVNFPHKHEYTAAVTVPTCTEKGYTRYTCAICGDSYVDSYVDAIGHDFQWVIDRVATATEDGCKHEECTRCGEKRNENTVIPAIGEDHEHSYTATVTAPTCTEQGYTTYTCSCGDSYKDNYTAALGHNYVDGICDRCGAEDPGDKPTVSFTDVKGDEWFAEAVNYAVSNGLMNGMGGNKFEPNTGMTRAMLVTVLWRYAGSPIEGENTFADLTQDWYIPAVTWAAHNGIVGGVGNGKFDPDGNVTREQMAAILYRYSNFIGADTSSRVDLSSFPDANKVSSYAEEALSWAAASGLITGTKEGSKTYLDPLGNATRAQVATILMRYIENVLS